MYGDVPNIKLSLLQRYDRTLGLRSEAPPSECQVYKLESDGSKGDLLRVEQPAYSTLPKLTKRIRVKF